MKALLIKNKFRYVAIIIIFAHLFSNVMLQAQSTNPVGAIPGVIDVSPMGAATYAIPIEVVPGTQGVQPNLSVVYNSFGGMGILGMKWNLAGLSAITRCGLNPYYDGDIATIRFNQWDKFALDGERLIQISNGTYGSNGVQYAAEVENFIRVTSYSNNNGSPEYFIAHTDDGSVIEYGSSYNSRQIVWNNSKHSTLSWLISKITDANGNYMNFYYESSKDDEIWIKEIEYTGNDNAGIKPYAKVVFDYTELPATFSRNTLFMSGYEIPLQTQLLKTITVYYDEKFVRKYEFEYMLKEERTPRLGQIILHSENNTQLDATIIKWGDKKSSLKQKSITGLPVGKILTGDFNGDGFTDLLLYDTESKGKGWKLYLYDPVEKKYELEKSDRTAEYEQGMIYAVDINGDGKDELILGKMKPHSTGYYHEFTFHKLFRYPGDNSLQISPIHISNFDLVSFGDFDGDGNIDISFRVLAETINFWNLKFFNFDGANMAIMGRIDNINAPLINTAILDVNGNGKKNIQVKNRYNNTVKIYEYNGTDFQSISSSLPAHNPYTRRYYGDINGDGITDVLVYTGDESYKWKIFIAKGDGTFYQSYLGNGALNTDYISSTNDTPENIPILVDLNGDGKDDIIQGVYSNNETTFKILLSKGCVNNGYSYTEEIIKVPGKYNLRANWHIGDFNGDGKLGILLKDTARSLDAPKIIYFEQDNNYEFVTEIKDGMKKIIQLNYKHQYSRAKSKQRDGIPAERKCFLPVIESIKVSNGIGEDLNTLQYRYHTAIYSSPRRTFLGFNEFVSINSQENMRDSLSFDYNTSDYIYHNKQMLKPYMQWSYCGNQLTTYKIFSTSIKDLDDRYRRFAYYGGGTVFDYLANTRVETTNTLSNHGRMIESVAKTFTGSTLVHSETTALYYKKLCLTSSSHQKTALVGTSSTQQYGNNGTPVTHAIVYEYYSNTDPNKGRLKEVKEINDQGTITTSYKNYTPTGLYQEKTVSAANCESRTEKYKYDDHTHRFVTKVTNPISHSATLEYDPKTGNKLKETDANNLTTTYKYDSFGNLTRVNYPDGAQTNISVSRYTSPHFPNARYRTYTSTLGSPSSTVYYDMLGREVCRLEDGYYSETRYNAKGQVTKTSAPFNLTIQDTVWHYYTYDNMGRQATVKGPYTDLTYNYDVRKVTVTDRLRNVSSSKTYDALGRIIEAEDEGGIIKYNYAVTGSGSELRHQTTIDVEGAITTILTDLWGNRRSIKEPNAGEIFSEYNGFNELVKQTDARGDTTKYWYDKLGRVIQKQFTDPDGREQTIVYEYDTRKKGKLMAIYMDKKKVEEFVYDHLSRLSIYEKIIDGEGHRFDYEYNTNGRLRTLTYPSGFQVTYSYTIGGKLNKIRRSDDNSLIYRANERNKYRLTTRCEYGNGVATEYEYSPYGLITRIQTGNKSLIQPEEDPGEETFDLWDQPMIPPYTVDSAFLNYRYAYDDRGLIVSRSERVIDYHEDYKYDKLDRLTDIISGPVGAVNTWQGFSYLPNGNFETNSALGVYAYQNNEFGMLKAHAVSEIALTGNSSSPGLHDVTYNFFNQPTQIKEDKYRLNLFYGANQQRQKVERYFDDVKETTRYYINKHYEQEDDHATKTTSRYHYIYGDNGVVALYITTGPTSNGGGGGGGIHFAMGITEDMYYIHTDHLGSYCAITDEGKNVVQRSFFDPWGNVVDLKLSLNFVLTDRGFTGHEHYPKLKIINMNGRLYDPVIARFFSPDKYVANSSFTQDFNRYTYCRNNPLHYTDPSGEFLWAIPLVGAMVGAFMNVAMNTDKIQNTGQFFAYMGIGALAGFAGGAATAGITGAAGIGFVQGFTAGFAGGFTSGFINSAGNTWTQGGSAEQGFFSGLQSGFISGGISGLTAGIIGGIQAKMSGASFGDGSYTHEYPANGTADFSEGKTRAANYNKSAEAAQRNKDLPTRTYKHYDKSKVTKYVSKLTTNVPDGYGLTSDYMYVNSDGKTIGGICKGFYGKKPASVHISPWAADAADPIFKAVVGHELIHAYHHYAYGSMYNSTYSEYNARRYSFETLWDARYYKASLQYFYIDAYYPRYNNIPLWIYGY